ncbi:hypothetical protein Ahy_A07g031303 isoform B [Arachis hypogaea]|uniref:Uncharacterized protein n=1 Tax=Arachis hypogaea TaxID=3818 RepID=A0A445C3H8_ARAHY|nr:hypothetical protein Ahy_A07g031303 isoform B [Arachis hypogaea]
MDREDHTIATPLPCSLYHLTKILDQRWKRICRHAVLNNYSRISTYGFIVTVTVKRLFTLLQASRYAIPPPWLQSSDMC